MGDFYLTDIYVSYKEPCVYLLGQTDDRESVAVRVHGYTPHFYVHVPGADRDQVRCNALTKILMQKCHLVYRAVVVQKRFMFGHRADVPLTVQVSCKSLGNMKKCMDAVRQMLPDVHVYEDKKDSRVAALRELGLCMFGSVKVSNARVPQCPPFSRCVFELECDAKDLSSEPVPNFPPLVVAAYDLETSGLRHETDYIFQISLIVAPFPFTGDTDMRKILLCTLPIDDAHDDFEVVRCVNEHTLIEKFVELVCDLNVTILTQWNGSKFDAPFLNARAARYESTCMHRLSRLLPHVAQVQFEKKELSSAAFGSNEFSVYRNMFGLVEVDGLMQAKKSVSLKLNNYKLNTVAHTLLGAGKDDVDYKFICNALSTRDPELIYTVGKYCIKDSVLVLQIFERLKELESMIMMSSIAGIPLSYIAERGQSIKCASLIEAEAYKRNYIRNTPTKYADMDGYEGAKVIDSKTGYYRSPVCVMDFNSLYPSIMMAYNLSPECEVGLESVQFSGDDRDLAMRDSEGRLHVFINKDQRVVFDSRGVEDPVVPAVLKYLVGERKAVRAAMAGVTDKVALSQMDAKQLTLKILSNSCYGLFGCSFGPVPDLPIAAATTSIGRMSINKVCRLLADAGYPDIVAGDTDSVMLLMKGKSLEDSITTAKQLCSTVLNAPGTFPPPMKIEFEKAIYPMLVFTKKRYAGQMYESATGPSKLLFKGITAARRDNAPIVSKTVKAVLDCALGQNNLQAALDHVLKTLRDLVDGKIPTDDLIIRKELKKAPSEYASHTPHGSLVERMCERNPDTAPKLGERVPYIIKEGKGEVYERSEDPAAANVKIDMLYYLQQQMYKPLKEIFDVVDDDDVTRTLERAFDESCSVVKCRQQKQRRISDFFGPPIKRQKTQV